MAKVTQSSHSRLKSKVGVVAVTLALATTLSVGAPTAAHAAEWHLKSTSTRCTTYSFGTLCTVSKQYFRQHASWCQQSPPWWGLTSSIQSWYAYCHKTVNSTVWK